MDIITNNSVVLLDGDETASIHVRLTDYLQSTEFNGICTHNYYKNAINYMIDNANVRRFYVFSDDIFEAKIIFSNIISLDSLEFIFVEHDNVNDYTVEDLFLMSQCKHHIIANSSYSWWAAWIGEQEDSIICVPDKWDRYNIRKEIVPDRWIRIRT